MTSNHKDKFHYCCKLVHELSANVFEMFKMLDKRVDARTAHLFKITKTDFNCEPLDLVTS